MGYKEPDFSVFERAAGHQHADTVMRIATDNGVWEAGTDCGDGESRGNSFAFSPQRQSELTAAHVETATATATATHNTTDHADAHADAVTTTAVEEAAPDASSKADDDVAADDQPRKSKGLLSSSLKSVRKSIMRVGSWRSESSAQSTEALSAAVGRLSEDEQDECADTRTSTASSTGPSSPKPKKSSSWKAVRKSVFGGSKRTKSEQSLTSHDDAEAASASAASSYSSSTNATDAAPAGDAASSSLSNGTDCVDAAPEGGLVVVDAYSTATEADGVV